MLQILQFLHSPLLLQLLEPIEDDELQFKVALEGLLFGVVEIEVALHLQLLELQLLLLGADRVERGLAAIKRAFVVEPQQHLTLAHPLAFLDQHLLQYSSHGHLHRLDVADRLQLAGGHHHLVGAGQRQPGQTGRCGAHQHPGDRAGQEAGLLQRHAPLAAGDPALDRVLGSAEQGTGGGTPGLRTGGWGDLGHQPASCWR